MCVIGSGPAGLTVADRLSHHGVDVLIVETGGREPSAATQELSAVEQIGTGHIGDVHERTRAIGGNSTAWSIRLADARIGVRYLPLDPVDLAGHGRLGRAGWPIAHDELAPFYEVAQTVCESGPPDYEPRSWVGSTPGPWIFDESIIENKVFQFGPRAAFSDRAVGRLKCSQHARLLYGATVVELISPDASSTVTGALCRRLDGAELTIEADEFVVAGGGLGNAHLLLASNSARPAGLGNGHDLVGRYLQDHVLLDGGSLVPVGLDEWRRGAFYDLRLVDGHNVLGHLALARPAIERHDLAGLSASLFPRPSERRTMAIAAFKELAHDGRTWDRSHLATVLQEAKRLALGLDYVAIAGYRKLRYRQSLLHGFGRGGWLSMPRPDRKFTRFEIVHQAEQLSNAMNRVTLSRDRDRLGMSKLVVNWSWSVDDARRSARGRRLMAEEIGRSGVGVVELPDDDDLPGIDEPGGTAHHTGTTRMSHTERDGVVDSNGRLHDVANVHVAGSSVFPSSGYANPTLTIVALAARLADHLAERVIHRPPIVAGPVSQPSAAQLSAT